MNKPTPIRIPVNVVGAGSQPADADGAAMEFMQMPSGMHTYSAPSVPETDDMAGLDAALETAQRIQAAVEAHEADQHAAVFSLDALDQNNRQFIDQLLGEGEVSVQCSGEINALIQESVLAGIWRVQYTNAENQVIKDTVEVAAIPDLVSKLTFSNAAKAICLDQLDLPDSVYNAAPILTELSDKLKSFQSGDEPHVINLSLLPHTEEDIEVLSANLGIGPNVILSRGYGNCRISSTATANIWWVQYFNSQDTLILNTLEMSTVPEVACASAEDLTDSADRLAEILSIYATHPDDRD